jgi:hypothetical protein
MRYGSSSNSSLSASASARKDTSPRKARADKYSARVITNGGQRKPITGSGDSQRRGSKTIRGSLAGLNNPNSNHIELNNSNYGSKNLQTKRYNKEYYDLNRLPKVDSDLKSLNFKNSKNYSIIDNYSGMSREKSSSDLINGIVKSNMSFR